MPTSDRKIIYSMCKQKLYAFIPNNHLSAMKRDEYFKMDNRHVLVLREVSEVSRRGNIVFCRLHQDGFSVPSENPSEQEKER